MFRVFSVLLACALTDYSSEAQIAKEVEVEGYKAYSHGIFFVNEPEGPVEIKEAQAIYVPQGSAFLIRQDALSYPAKAHNRVYPEDAHIRINLRAEGEDVVAARYYILFYNLFKEHMKSYSIIQMDGMVYGETMEAVFTPPGLQLFQNYGVVGMFVRKARLHDGSIWEYNEDLVIRTLATNFIHITKKHLEYSPDDNVVKAEKRGGENH